MANYNDRIMAEYAIARFRQGFDYLALYIAATLYERVISNKLKAYDPCEHLNISSNKNPNKLANHLSALEEGMNNKTIPLQVCDAFTFPEFFNVDANPKKAISKLYQYRNLRNEIIHSDDQESMITHNSREIAELLLYVVAECSPETFEQTFEETSTFDIDGIRAVFNEVTADYMIRSVDEIMIHRYDKLLTPVKNATYFDTPITLEDFNNLFAMRAKLVALKHDLQYWLEEELCRDLKTTILTTIDTASGYIWLPLIHKSHCSDGEERPNLNHATAAIMATPLDFRIYIDFGGYCKSERLKYYDFLRNENGDFKKFIKDLSSADRAIFRLFDVEWFSSITHSLSTDEITGDPDGFHQLIDRAINVVEESGETIITSNKLLSGFVIDRRWIEQNEELPVDFIFDKLRKIIDLYYDLLLNSAYDKTVNEESVIQ